MSKYKLFEKLSVCLCNLFQNLGSYLTTTSANGSLLTLLIIIIEAAPERCPESKKKKKKRFLPAEKRLPPTLN